MYFLFQAGFLLEKSIGTAQYAILFASTTLLSVYALYLFAPRSNTIGISGFCMAILSYLWITLSENGSPEATNIGFLLLLNIFMGFLPGISFVGHMAGAVSGLCFWYMSHILF